MTLLMAIIWVNCGYLDARFQQGKDTEMAPHWSITLFITQSDTHFMASFPGQPG